MTWQLGNTVGRIFKGLLKQKKAWNLMKKKIIKSQISCARFCDNNALTSRSNHLEKVWWFPQDWAWGNFRSRKKHRGLYRRKKNLLWKLSTRLRHTQSLWFHGRILGMNLFLFHSMVRDVFSKQLKQNKKTILEIHLIIMSLKLPRAIKPVSLVVHYYRAFEKNQ